MKNVELYTQTEMPIIPLSTLQSLQSLDEIEELLLKRHDICVAELSMPGRPRIFNSRDVAHLSLFLLEGVFMQDITDYFSFSHYENNDIVDVRNAIYIRAKRLPTGVRNKIFVARANAENIIRRYKEKSPTFSSSIDAITQASKLSIDQIFRHIPATFQAGTEISFVIACNAVAGRLR